MPNVHRNIRELFTEIANSIRYKTGNTEKIKADDFPDAIDEIVVEKIGTPVPEDGYMTDTQAVIGYLQGDISGAYKNSEITKVKQYAFVGHHNLTKVSFPACVTVGSRAFEGCQGLTWVSLPNVKTISICAFQSCTSLQSVTVPKCSNLGTRAFTYCSSLEQIYIEDAKIINEDTFYQCSALKAATFPSVTNIGVSAFGKCISLETINFPACVSVSASAFYNCTSLKSIYFPFLKQINTYAFENCTNLETALLPAIETIYTRAFYNCTSLKSISFYYATNVSNSAFANCHNLSIVSLPNLSLVLDSCFYNCYNLQSVAIPKATGVRNAAFMNCSELTEISLPSCVALTYSCFQNCIKLSKVFLPNVSSISFYYLVHGNGGFWGFYNCTSLKSIDMPKLSSAVASFTHTNNYELESAWYSSVKTFSQRCFENCYKLWDVRASSLNTIGSYVFLNCSALVSVSFPALTSLYTCAFQNCISLASVDFPNLVVISSSVFYGCYNLESVYMNKLSTISEYMFYSCSMLSDIQFNSCTQINQYAFANCQALSSVNFPNCTILQNNVFQNCINIRYASFGKVTVVPSALFYDAEKLESVYFPSASIIYGEAFNGTNLKTVTSENFPVLTEIRLTESSYLSRPNDKEGLYGVFGRCSNLELVELPNVSHIKNNAYYHIAMFGGCPKLSLVSFRNLTSITRGYQYYTNPFMFGDYESLYLPLLNTSLSYMFSGARRLKSIYAPCFSVLESHYFYGCSELEEIGNDYGMSGIVKFNGSSAFTNCVKLRIASFPNVTVMSNGTSTFENCTSLEEVYFPNVKELQMSYIFENCRNIKSLNFDACSYFGSTCFASTDSFDMEEWFSAPGITTSAGFGYRCFAKGFHKLNFPNLSGNSPTENAIYRNSVLTHLSMEKCQTILLRAFQYCTSLKSVYFPNATTIQSQAFQFTAIERLDDTNFTKLKNIATSAFLNCSKLSVIDNNSVLSVDNSAFYNCTALTYISLPACTYIYPYNTFYGLQSSTYELLNLNAISTIVSTNQVNLNARKVYLNNATDVVSHAFRYCSRIEHLEMNSLQIIRQGVFVGCTSLSSETTFPNVISIYENAFSECSFPEIPVTMFPNLTMLSMRYTFANNPNLSRARFSKLTTLGNDGNNIVGHTFYNTPNLKEVTLDALENGRLYVMFGNHSTIETINLPNLKTINFVSAFLNCISLTEINAPKLASIISNNTFGGCTALSKVSFPSLSIISSYTFNGCRSLEDVYLPNLTKLEYCTFNNCISLKSLTLPNVTSILIDTRYSSTMSPFFNCTSLEYLELPKVTNWNFYILPNTEYYSQVPIKTLKLDNVTTMSNSACYNYTKLGSIYAPNLTTILNSAFCLCTALSELELPKLTTVSMHNQFQSCYSLKKVSFPELTALNTGAFANCSALEDVYMPKLERIGMYTFQGCVSLKSLTLQALNSIDYNYSSYIMAFGYGVSLDYLELPAMSSFHRQMGFDKSNPNAATVKNLSLATCTHFSNSAFYNQTELSKIYIPAAIDIGTYVFYGTAISEVSIPECTRVDIEAFGQCHNLSKIYLPKVTAANAPFNNCINLHTARFDALNQIWGYNWFYNNVKMKSLYMLTDVVPSQYERYDIVSVFANSPFVNSTFFDPPEYGSIYVKESMYDAFVNNTWWKPLSDRIVALPPPYDFTI